MARGKGGAKTHGQERSSTLIEKERQICPLCIEPLDPTEKRFFPCPCGYQVCLFCFRRLKEEFSNQCPGCRTVYGSDFDTGRRLRNEVKQDRPSSAADVSAVPLPGTLQRPTSPAVQNVSQSVPHKQFEPALEHEISRPELSPIRASSPLAARQNHVQAEGAGQQQQQPSALLQLSQGAPVTPDPDGAALLASTQQRVANGGLSVREAARLLVSFLRAKQAAADSASNQSSFYSNGLPGSLNGGVASASPLRQHAARSNGTSDGAAERQPSMGLQGAGGADGGLLSSLLGNSQGAPSISQASSPWPNQQPQPDDDLMRLLWGNHSMQQGSRQLSWTHDAAQPNGRDAQMEGHVPLYARSKNGMQHDMKRWDQGEKANGGHGQNGFSHAAWLSPVSIPSELAAIAMSAPPK